MFFIRYMRCHCERFRSGVAPTVAEDNARWAIHKVEPECIHELDTNWKSIKEAVSLYTIVAIHAHHFRHRDSAKELYRQLWDDCPPHCLVIHADFGEHHSLPIGPVERVFLCVIVCGLFVWVCLCGCPFSLATPSTPPSPPRPP